MIVPSLGHNSIDTRTQQLEDFTNAHLQFPFAFCCDAVASSLHTPTMELAAEASLPSSNGMNLKDVLKIFLIIWEAAVRACPVFSVSSIRKSEAQRYNFPAWIFEVDLQAPRTYGNPLPGHHQGLWRYFQYYNLCETSIMVLMEPLREKLQGE